MRWIKFTAEGRTAYGIVEGDQVIEVKGDPFEGYERTGRKHALNSIKIEVPVTPRTFYCAGMNYTAHVLEHAAKHKIEPNIPKKADIGYRANNALIAHNEPVVIPHDATDAIQYEGELVAVVGKKVKHLTEANALSCLLGYTIGNDVSERNWQKMDRTFWRGKNADTFKPMGPWIDTDFNPDNADTIVRVNGKVTTQFKTNDMLFSAAQYIAEMTKYLTLYPGDVIWMGTDGTSPNLKAGDVVEIEITGLGTLRNPFVAEKR